MVSLEQVKLLESRVAKAIDHVTRLTTENAVLHKRETELKIRLDSYKKRVEELEAAVMRFKDDQSRIEDGILAALDRLSQFEEAVEKSLKDKNESAKTPAKAQPRPAAKEAKAPPETACKAENVSADTPETGEVFFDISNEEDISESGEEPSELDIF
jgi:FtsZ-binding cell division protein ZapB